MIVIRAGVFSEQVRAEKGSRAEKGVLTLLRLHLGAVRPRKGPLSIGPLLLSHLKETMPHNSPQNQYVTTRIASGFHGGIHQCRVSPLGARFFNTGLGPSPSAIPAPRPI